MASDKELAKEMACIPRMLMAIRGDEDSGSDTGSGSWTSMSFSTEVSFGAENPSYACCERETRGTQRTVVQVQKVRPELGTEKSFLAAEAKELLKGFGKIKELTEVELLGVMAVEVEFEEPLSAIFAVGKLSGNPELKVKLRHIDP